MDPQRALDETLNSALTGSGSGAVQSRQRAAAIEVEAGRAFNPQAALDETLSMLQQETPPVEAPPLASARPAAIPTAKESEQTKPSGGFFERFGRGMQARQAVQQEAANTGSKLVEDVVAAAKATPTAFSAAATQFSEGNDPGGIDWKNEAVATARQRARENAMNPELQEEYMLGINRATVRNLPNNLAFSVLSMGAGLSAAAPAFLAGSAVSTPLGGTVAGGTAGFAASGMAAYRMDTNNFLRDIRDELDRGSLQARGKPLTDGEFVEVAKQYESLVREHGLWEALPEAVGNVIGLGVGKVLFSAAAPGLKGVITKAGAAGLEFGGELATETVTQIGQTNVEVDAGLSDQPKRSFTNVDDIRQSAKEVLPDVLLLTGVVTGTSYAAGKVYNSTAYAKNKQIADQLGRIIDGAEPLPNAAEAEAIRRLDVNSYDPALIDPAQTVRPASDQQNQSDVSQVASAIGGTTNVPDQPEPPDTEAGTETPPNIADQVLQDTAQQVINEIDAQRAAQEAAAAQPSAPAQTLTDALASMKSELGVDAAESLSVTEVTDNTRLNRFKNALESSFGVKVHWVDFGEQITTGSGKQLGSFSGFRNGDTLLISANDVDLIDTTWHELTHVLEIKHQDVYASLRDRLVPAMDPTVRQNLIDALNQRRQAEVGRDMTAQEIDSELVAYVVGDLVRNPQTLGEMFDSFGDPAIAKTFRDVLADILQKMLAVIKGPQYIKERARLVEAQKAVTAAFAEYQKRETQKIMAAPVQQQTATAPAAPAAATPAPAPAPAPTVGAKLPRDLAGAKPRYAIGKDQFDLEFDSDIEKALFIVSQKSKSKRDADYRKWLVEAGVPENTIGVKADQVRQQIKRLATGRAAGTLRIRYNPFTSPASPAGAAETQVAPTMPPAQEAAQAAPAEPTEQGSGETPSNNNFARRVKPAPVNTVKAYKLFRVDAKKPGQLFPLFVKANDPVQMGEWLDAESGENTPSGKVKSKIGPLAYRPGWHAGDLPIATHIGAKSSASLKKPDLRPDNHVWAEVELAADRDWQTEANRRGMNTAGQVVPVRAQIDDQIPEDGFYRYKTNPNMTGNWLIGGSMKVNRILSDAEVEQINRAAGTSDLKRSEPFSPEKYGFTLQQAMPEPVRQTAPAPSPAPQTIPDDANTQQTEAPENRFRLNIERTERAVDETAELTPAEIQAINKAAIKLKVPRAVVNDLLAEAVATKRRFPPSDGWAPLTVRGLLLKKGSPPAEAELNWQANAYKYNVPEGVGRAPQKIDEAWAEQVSDAFYKEIKSVFTRADNGDKNSLIIIAHKNWYRNVTEVLRREFGAMGDLLADLLGATSPNTPVDTNWRFSIDILRRFVRGDFDAEMREFAKYIAKGGNPTKYPAEKKIAQISGKLYGMNSTNAQLALLNVWRQIKPKQAPKARNFALNLIGQSDMATIDVWAARMLRRVANIVTGNNLLPRIPPPAEQGVTGNWNAKATAVTGEFGFGARVMETVSKRLAAEGIDVSPPDLQAIAWFVEKELWATNDWTSAQGEGGSFEENIVKMPMERYLAGWSIQQGERVPEEAAVSVAQARVANVLARDGSVIAFRVLPTKGLYGEVIEESFDTEWTVERGKHNPALALAEIAQVAKENSQYDIFVSKVIQPGENNPNARPGVELFFRDQKSLDAAMPTLNQFTSQGVDGFTMAVDPRAEGGNYIGVRLQYIPEISMRWDEQFRTDALKEGFIEAALAEKTRQLDRITAQVSQMDGVAFAKTYQYDTIVVGKENYDDFIDRAVAAEDSGAGAGVWFGQPIRGAVERAASRLNSDQGSVAGGDVQDASGADSEGQTKGQFSRRITVDGVERPTQNSEGRPIFPTEEGIVNFWRWFGDSKVVDSKGQPIVLYHGSPPVVDSVTGEEGIQVAQRGSGIYGFGFYTTGVQSRANQYARAMGQPNVQGSVYPVYVKLENPISVADFRKRYGGTLLGADRQRAATDELQLDGFDGVLDKTTNKVWESVSFEPSSVKSAVGNSGEFSATDNRNNFARRVSAQGSRFALPDRSLTERFFREKFEDNLSRVDDIQNAVVTQGGTVDMVDAQGNPVGTTNISDAASRMRGAVRAKMERFKKEIEQPLIERASELGVNFDEVAQYLYAVYAPERNATIQQRNPTQFPTDGGSGMTNAEATQIVAAFRARPDFNNIQEIARGVRRIVNLTQNVLLTEGLIEPQVIAQWNRESPNYVPLRGFENFNEETGENLNVGTPGRRDPRNPFVRVAKGRDSKAGLIIENVLKDYYDALMLAEKNKVYLRLLQFVKDNPDPTLWQINAPAVSRSYYKAGMSPLGYAQGDVRIAYEVNENPNETIAVRVKGRVVFIRIQDEAMLEQLKMEAAYASDQDAALGWRIAGAFVRFKAKMLTVLSPVFVMIDAIRNNETAGLYNIAKTEGGFARKLRVTGRSYQRLFKAARTAWKAERDQAWQGNTDTITIREPGQPPRTITLKEAYDMYRNDGGKVGYMDIKDIYQIRKDIEQRYRAALVSGSFDPRTYVTQMLNVVNKVEDLMLDIAGSVDSATRFATYMARLEAGFNRQEATDAAKNVTVNFDKRGKWTPYVGALYMFAHASFRGNRQFYDLFFKSGKVGAGLAGGLIGLGYTVAMFNALIDGEDGEPLWDKKYYKQAKLKSLLFFTPDGDDHPIPMPYGSGFFVNIGYALADAQRGVPLAKTATFMRDSFFTHFSPLGSMENVATFLSPTLGDAVLVTAYNETEQGLPLYPESTFKPNMPDSEKMWASTRGTMWADVARWLNVNTGGTPARKGPDWYNIDVSPEELRYWYSFVFGGAGGFVRDIADSIYLTSEVGLDSAVEKNKIPLLRSFYRQNTGKQNQIEFFENSKAAVAELQAFKDEYGTEWARRPDIRARNREYRGLVRLGASVSDYNKALSNLRQREIEIIDKRSSGLYTAAEAERRLKKVAEEKNDLYVRFNREFYRASPDTPD